MKKLEANQTLPELVYTAIVNAIAEGTLRPGQRVTQRGLAERLDVSRLPVGQAMKRLEKEGFLSPLGRKGLQVSVLDSAFVESLYEFRSGIDQLCAGLAAQRIRPMDERRGEFILKAGRTAGRARDVPALIDADMEFHQFIYEITGNELIIETMEAHWNQTRRIMRDILIVPQNQEQIWKEHEQIFIEICAGRVDRSEQLARQHVDNATRWLLGELNSVSDRKAK